MFSEVDRGQIMKGQPENNSDFIPSVKSKPLDGYKQRDVIWSAWPLCGKQTVEQVRGSSQTS